MTITRPHGTRSPGTRSAARLRPARQDAPATAAAAFLVACAALFGTALDRADGTLYVDWPPLYASWHPHVGPGTPAALAVGALVAGYGPGAARRLPWRTVLAGAWATALAWTWSLALVDGWQRGVAGRLTTVHEYLRAVDRFSDIGPALRGYTGHILLTQPDHWPAHVSGHPPAAVLTFVGLDRTGLGGGGWAGAWCITVGSSATLAVLLTVRALAGERTARRTAPFVALSPGAVWVGASADGYFAAVTAWGLALLALAATRSVRAPGPAACAAGLLLALGGYLSYGLVLTAVPAAAVLAAARSARPLPYVLAGATVVAAVFTLAGFHWWEGYRLLVERYYQGVGAKRPYSYWVWGNLACAVIATGLAPVAGLRRCLPAPPGAGGDPRRAPAGRSGALAVLAAGAVCAIVLADLSGLSKGETERIWLPFTTLLLPVAGLLPPHGHRRWLAAQATLALLVNHLLLTAW